MRWPGVLLFLAASLSAQPFPIKNSSPSSQVSATESLKLTAQAREALWLRSDLSTARELATKILAKYPSKRDALFVLMEAASLQADPETELDAAIRLCQQKFDGDSRITIAAARILSLAANTEQFRAAIPRLKVLVSNDFALGNYIRSALLAAAMDGAPGLSPLKLAVDSGLVTDWRVAGPFGKFGNVDFEQKWEPEQDDLRKDDSDGRKTESLRFDDGSFVLPEYFKRKGVFYAAASLRVSDGGTRILRVQSPGTIEVFIDEVSVLRKDNRFRNHGEILRVSLQMRPGRHRLLVKFLPYAMPFQVSVVKSLPGTAVKARMKVPEESGQTAEDAYISGALKYWAGSFEASVRELRNLENASAKFLLAAAWNHISEDAPEAGNALRSGIALAPNALLLSYELAKAAFENRKADLSLQYLSAFETGPIRFAPATELLARVLAWKQDIARTADAYSKTITIHPSCSNLMDAFDWYSRQKRFEQANNIANLLSGCAPGSLDRVKVLSRAGEHEEAALEAEYLAQRYPLRREIQEFLVQELVLTGKSEQARTAAHNLASMAPNSETYTRIATSADIASALDSNGSGITKLGFYEPYRRDVWDLLKKKTADTRPASLVVNDRVTQLNADNSVLVYEHRVVRLRNREGVDQNREAQIPTGAEIIELRTLKADGSIVEPEFTNHKETITMPALMPGDAVEQEYVMTFPRGGVDGNPDKFQFTFGSFKMPVENSRFVVIAPEDQRLRAVPFGEPESESAIHDGQRILSWEMHSLPEAYEELSTPHMPLLPTVQIFAAEKGWEEIRDNLRDQFIQAVRIGFRVEEAAKLFSAGSDEERARQIYHYVASTIRSTRKTIVPGFIPSAERTLARRAGSRTAVMLAIARDLGLQADLVMAREVDSAIPAVPHLRAYPRPLVMFRLATPGKPRNVLVDAEGDEHAFDLLPPDLETSDALNVALESAPKTQSPIIGLLRDPQQEHTVAEGDLKFDGEGTMTAHVNIRLGASRSAEARRQLTNADSVKRSEYFEQLASGIFQGASGVRGKSKNEGNTDLPLEVSFDCVIEDALNVDEPNTELNGIVPTFDLRKVYAKTESRTFPLFVDSPLFESLTLYVHVPASVSISAVTPESHQYSKFGNYLSFVKNVGENTLEFQREFNIPVQVILSKEYPQFLSFVTRTEKEEIKSLNLAVERRIISKPSTSLGR